MSKNVFVSMPMSGKTEEEMWNEVFEVTTEYMRTHPDEEVYFHANQEVTLDTIKDIPCKSGNENLLYLSEALKRMAICDDVVFHKDWEQARGCRVERLIYELYFLPRVTNTPLDEEVC